MRVARRLMVPSCAASLLTVGVLWLSGVAPTAAGEAIGGVVRGPAGPEAGVWVIAETSELPTRFRKIVVTDDAGRFLVPDLPAATYDVWVRGYGLMDSEKTPARPGDALQLAAAAAPTPAAAAQIYPANYWFSLLDVPPASEFPGTGPQGNGISPEMRTQAHWVDRLKAGIGPPSNDGCQLCHQLGNKATREIPALSLFDSTAAAWDKRMALGGSRMNNGLTSIGRERGIESLARWTDQIRAGAAVPPMPPRPQGKERNIVLSMWGWGSATGSVHDETTTDKRNPALFANGPVYGVGGNSFLVTDPVAHRSRQIPMASRDPNLRSHGAHNPMLDGKGRVWITKAIRGGVDNPSWCKSGSTHPSAAYFPLDHNRMYVGDTIGRQVAVYDPRNEQFVLSDTCFYTHHLQFAADPNDTLYFSGDSDVVGWLNVKQFDATGDEQASQAWCPTVLDTNGDGRITRPWNEPEGPHDRARDTRIAGFAYGIIPNPADGSIWITRRVSMPGPLVRLELGANPPQTCKAEVYEPPFDTPSVDRRGWGFGPRGIDVDRHGVIWTALAGSGHLASFDRRKCKVLNGPTATGQHCPEGWTLYPVPGPKMKGIDWMSADFHYYNWVDQFNSLGFGENVPIAAGSGSDSLLALDPQTREWLVMRVPYPLGFYTRGMDGRIDDPGAGWKGRGVWATYAGVNSHIEGGRGMTSEIIRFQLRPSPLAE